MADPVLIFQDVTRKFVVGAEEVTALANASCVIHAGDRIAVMGPSGSGKSTLMALIAQLDMPSSGAISWPKFPPAESVRPKYIGLSFQSPSLIAALTAVENVEVPLLVLELGSKAREKAFEMLKVFGLEHLADRLPEELSGGQAQRIAMARALVTSPALILADEPTGQLDQETGHLVMRKLKEISDTTGAALLIATHDPIIAAEMNTVWHMRYGALDTSNRIRNAL
ncbi:MAG: ABC transporter ATP-binding protein [Aestuariivirga sp.]